MKFKGNQPVPESVHPDPDQQPVLYPEPRKFPDDYQTIEEADRVETENEGDPNEGDNRLTVEPPTSNLIPFHKPMKRRVPPDHNM